MKNLCALLKSVRHMLPLFFGLLLVAGTPSYAKSFTKDEIKKMISKKKYPNLGIPQVSERDIPMEDCEKFISEQRVNYANQGWPTKIVKESPSLVIIEIWGSNAKTTLRCENDQTRIEVQDYEL